MNSFIQYHMVTSYYQTPLGFTEKQGKNDIPKLEKQKE